VDVNCWVFFYFSCCRDKTMAGTILVCVYAALFLPCSLRVALCVFFCFSLFYFFLWFFGLVLLLSFSPCVLFLSLGFCFVFAPVFFSLVFRPPLSVSFCSFFLGFSFGFFLSSGLCYALPFIRSRELAPKPVLPL